MNENLLLSGIEDDQGSPLYAEGKVHDVAQKKTEKKGVGVVLRAKKTPAIQPGKRKWNEGKSKPTFMFILSWD